MATQTLSLQSKLGLTLYARHVDATDARGVAVVVHGLAEHSGRYEHVMQALADAKFSSIAPDLRGHGRSEGRRVYINRFDEYVADVDAAVRQARQLYPELPVVVIGHSMGGLVVLRYLQQASPGLIAAGVVSSPALGNVVKVPAWKDGLGKLMSKVWPTLGIPTGIPATAVSRDGAVVAAYEDDPLVTNQATARWYTEVLDAQAATLASVGRLETPLMMLLAGHDQLVDVDVARGFFDKLSQVDKRLEHYPACYHEVFNEPEKEQVLAAVVEWLDERVG